MVKHKHKRQKSSVSNINYYIDNETHQPEPNQLSPQRSNIKAEFSPNLLSHQLSPTHSNSQTSPILDYEDDANVYYNFPSNIQPSNIQPISLQSRSLQSHSLQPHSLQPHSLQSNPSHTSNVPHDRSYYHQIPTGNSASSSSYIDSFSYLPAPSSSSSSMSFTVPQRIPQSTIPNTVPNPIQTSPISKPLSTANTPRRSPKRKHQHQKSSSMSSIPQYSIPPLTQNNPVIQPISQPTHSLSEAKHRANLSISSHFNLFHLNEPEVVKKEFGPAFSSTGTASTGITKLNTSIKDFIMQLRQIEPSSINSYLLTLLKRIKLLPLDEFYNLLYNNYLTVLDNPQKLDKTSIDNSKSFNNLKFVHDILEVFKEPDSLDIWAHQGIIDMNTLSIIKETKLSSINYHELLRTFLAIKILSDMLIELPEDDERDITKLAIPRLSLYKTYFIICQKLLILYPSSFQSSNDNHKLILGQSKLGKLIKLVYPDLIIKRLGSRGESKYNYLGVIWNDNIVDDEIQQLCDDNELVELNEIFDSKYKSRFENQEDNYQPQITSLEASGSTGFETSIPVTSYQLGKGMESTTSLEYELFKPIYSFISLNLKFPNDFNVIEWIDSAKFQTSTMDNSSDISNIIALFTCDQQINISEQFFPKSGTQNRIYLSVLLELTSILLLLKPFDNIATLKTNLVEFINEHNSEADDLIKFKILLKQLISLNDSLMVITKLVFIDERILTRFKNYFNTNNYFTNFVNSLVSYNLEIPINLDFINKDLTNIKHFFVSDLVNFLDGLSESHTDTSNTLKFLNLLDTLINNFTNYSVNSSIQFVSLVINDIIKLVYFKFDSHSQESSFHHWWLINNFIQDYVSLVGELVGLSNLCESPSE